MNSLYNIQRLTALCIFLALFYSGCSDENNPAGNGGEDHEEAFGTMLILNGDTLVTIDGTNVTGDITIALSDTTDPIEVWFLSQDGIWFQVEEDELDHALEIVIADTSIAVALLGEDYPEFGSRWSFELIGLAAGNTTMSVQIFHEGHEDYVSPSIPAAVTP